MIIVYASRTRNVEKFCAKIDRYETVSVQDYQPEMGAYVLITYTTGFGSVPDEVGNFLKEHSDKMVGVCASGRSAWKLQGTYCKSADKIHNQYGVPILLKFDMAGTDRERETLIERIESIEQ